MLWVIGCATGRVSDPPSVPAKSGTTRIKISYATACQLESKNASLCDPVAILDSPAKRRGSYVMIMQ